MDRGIPYRPPDPGQPGAVWLGLQAAPHPGGEIDSTSAVAESIGQDKDLTKRLLHAAWRARAAGPPGRNVDAWAVAARVGLPVVVKPQDGNQGKGVTVNITDRAQPRRRLQGGRLRHRDGRALPAGQDFRLLVVGDQLVAAAAAASRPRCWATAKHTVRELVDIVNQDPRRGAGHGTSLTKIRLDDIAIARLALQNLTPESVPEKGQRVVLRNNANLSTGGTATDVTDDVHPGSRRAPWPRPRWWACTSAAWTWWPRPCCARSKNRAAASSR